MRKKYLLSMLLLIFVVLSATACKDKENTNDNKSKKINNESTQIGVIAQEYQKNNIVEILTLNYDGEQEALKEYGGKNPEIESLNNAVKFGIMVKYDEFMESDHGGEWIEIRSYPFTSEEYIQIVTTCNIFPAYGSDGELYSYNFDRKNNRFMNLEEQMKELGTDDETLAKQVKKLYVPESSSMSLGEVDAAGFLMIQGSDDYLTMLFLEAVIENSEGEPWKRFFSYIPELGELTQLNSQRLFDSSEMDQMTPPLSYQKESNPEDREHISVVSGRRTGYHDEIGSRLATVMFLN